MNDENWNELNPRNTILFLGSGFSLEAKNLSDKDYLDGKRLSKRLCEVLEENSEELPSLRDISDDFVPNRQALLLNTLLPLMTTKQISSDQREVILQPWKRVYTTNYDDVFEFGMIDAGKEPHTASFDSPVKKAKGGTQIVHLHGYIHECDELNIDEKLVLTERSYVRQLSKPRPWFDEFVDDARFAQNIVFVGYKLADTPINALLLSSPEIREKTSFVVRSEPVGRDRRKLEPYGKIRAIGLKGFAAHLQSSEIKSLGSSTPKRFLAFEELDPKKDKKRLDPATTVEVRNLLTYGRFDRLACSASWPEADYLIPRKSLIDEAIGGLGTSKTLVIHSRRGNGKSLFCEMLSIALAQKGWRCIRAKSQAVLSDDDLKLLKSQQRLVLFFRSHDDANYVMKQLGKPRQDMRFVVEVSTSISDVRANALSKQLAQPIKKIGLNGFEDQDRRDFERILDKAGILPTNFDMSFKSCNELRDYLIRLYQNTKIKDMLVEHARPLWDLPVVRRAMVSVFALKSLELTVTPALKREIIGEDPAAAMESAPNAVIPNIHDFFEFRDSSVEPFSTVVSQLLLNKFLTPADLTDWALKVASIAGRRKQELLEREQYSPRFDEAVKVMGRVLQVSRLRALLGDTPNKDELIRQMFEDARHVPEINAEPLFWLQFAISKDVDGATYEQLGHALEYIRTAYRRGADQQNFKTYQLDTYLLQILFRLEVHSDAPRGPLKHLDEICQMLKRFAEMLSEEAHRDFVLRVLERVEIFVTERQDDITHSEKLRLKPRLERIVVALDAFPDTVKVLYSIGGVRNSIFRAINRLDRL